MTDIGSCFNPKGHPDVKSGTKKVPILLREFFDTFETVTQNGYVTLEQFLEYYANASFFQDDDSFVKTMDSIWNTKAMNKEQPPKSLGGGGDGGGISLGEIANSREGHSQSSSPANSVLLDLQNQLKSRGAKGIIGLARKFRIMDDDGSKALRLSEFKKGLRESSFNIGEHDLVSLFNYFDRDRNGSIDFDEFLIGLRVSIDTICAYTIMFNLINML